MTLTALSIRTELAADLPRIVTDRVELQQVAMDLIVNSLEAMKDVDGIREKIIRSQRAEDDRYLYRRVMPAWGFRRTWSNRYSPRSLQLNLTASAWGFASVGQSSRPTVGGCGRSVPRGAARLFGSPYQLRLHTVVNYLTVRLLSGIRPPRDTGGVSLRGFGATHGSSECRSNGSALSFTFANLQSTIRSTKCANSHDLHCLRRSHWVCMSLNNLKQQAVTAEVKFPNGRIICVCYTNSQLPDCRFIRPRGLDL
jgi:hypothetical protein